MAELPLVSIVTPCLNAAEFLKETIESVLAQDYPHIEYLVMDGGSTDGTLAVLEGYRNRVKYISQPDQGTADAINKGFQQSRGSIVAWLSADDTYLPNAVSIAVQGFLSTPEAAVVYGEANWTDEDGRIIGRYPTVSPYSPEIFSRGCAICQPACFICRQAVEAVGGLDPQLRSAFDYDLWIRLSRKYSFVAIPQYLSTARMHVENKSLGEKQTMFNESIGLLQRHYGYVPVDWVYCSVAFQKDRTDQFFLPVRQSAGSYLRCLAIGSRYNRHRLFRYWREWLSRTMRLSAGVILSKTFLMRR